MRMEQPEVKKSSKSGHTCAVALCHSPREASYHRFPKNEEMNKVWLNACRRKDPVNVKTAYICSDHFQEADFERDFMNELLNLPTRRKLRPGNCMMIFILSFRTSMRKI